MAHRIPYQDIFQTGIYLETVITETNLARVAEMSSSWRRRRRGLIGCEWFPMEETVAMGLTEATVVMAVTAPMAKMGNQVL
jgi:hypothetical protein